MHYWQATGDLAEVSVVKPAHCHGAYKRLRYVDIPDLTRWLSARQHGPEGGLAGRTNKVIDGCYSHWIGGCWSFVEAAKNGGIASKSRSSESLWNREALTRYILCCCQADNGGLRDKPSMCVV